MIRLVALSSLLWACASLQLAVGNDVLPVTQPSGTSEVCLPTTPMLPINQGLSWIPEVGSGPGAILGSSVPYVPVPVDGAHGVGVREGKECHCESCVVVEEERVRLVEYSDTVCIDVFEIEETSVPYCKNECKDGVCTEKLGTRTIKKLVRRTREVPITLKKPEVYTVKVTKCVKCDAGITIRPESLRSDANNKEETKTKDLELTPQN